MGLNSVIFDLDGVLVFSDEYHYLAWKQIAEELGVDFDKMKNNRLRGVSRMESLEIVLEDYTGAPLGTEQKLELADKKNAIYRELLMNMKPSDVSDNVRYTLKELRKEGYRIAIGSSSKNSRFILEKVGLDDAFDAIADGTNITNSKPDPEVFLKAAEYLGTRPEDCLVVEDSESGINAAIAGGMKSAAIGDATKCENATYRINRLSDIVGILGVENWIST